ncbi:unnamed protein product [Symbiodinium sp. CCMP2592]|nr:unnamed protein product [Symbiodinium sp. CCMP2592]
MESLGKEIGTRQGVATRIITSSAIAELGGAMPAMAEGASIDPRCMSLDRCYEAHKELPYAIRCKLLAEVLQLSREELKQKQKEDLPLHSGCGGRWCSTVQHEMRV